jgi:hypothetical protein
MENPFHDKNNFPDFENAFQKHDLERRDHVLPNQANVNDSFDLGSDASGYSSDCSRKDDVELELLLAELRVHPKWTSEDLEKQNVLIENNEDVHVIDEWWESDQVKRLSSPQKSQSFISGRNKQPILTDLQTSDFDDLSEIEEIMANCESADLPFDSFVREEGRCISPIEHDESEVCLETPSKKEPIPDVFTSSPVLSPFSSLPQNIPMRGSQQQTYKYSVTRNLEFNLFTEVLQ